MKIEGDDYLAIAIMAVVLLCLWALVKVFL